MGILEGTFPAAAVPGLSWPRRGSQPPAAPQPPRGQLRAPSRDKPSRRGSSPLGTRSPSGGSASLAGCPRGAEGGDTGRAGHPTALPQHPDNRDIILIPSSGRPPGMLRAPEGLPQAPGFSVPSCPVPSCSVSAPPGPAPPPHGAEPPAGSGHPGPAALRGRRRRLHARPRPPPNICTGRSQSAAPPASPGPPIGAPAAARLVGARGARTRVGGAGRSGRLRRGERGAGSARGEPQQAAAPRLQPAGCVSPERGGGPPKGGGPKRRGIPPRKGFPPGKSPHAAPRSSCVPRPGIAELGLGTRWVVFGGSGPGVGGSLVSFPTASSSTRVISHGRFPCLCPFPWSIPPLVSFPRASSSARVLSHGQFLHLCLYPRSVPLLVPPTTCYFPATAKGCSWAAAAPPGRDPGGPLGFPPVGAGLWGWFLGPLRREPWSACQGASAPKEKARPHLTKHCYGFLLYFLLTFSPDLPLYSLYIVFVFFLIISLYFSLRFPHIFPYFSHIFSLYYSIFSLSFSHISPYIILYFFHFLPIYYIK